MWSKCCRCKSYSYSGSSDAAYCSGTLVTKSFKFTFVSSSSCCSSYWFSNAGSSFTVALSLALLLFKSWFVSMLGLLSRSGSCSLSFMSAAERKSRLAPLSKVSLLISKALFYSSWLEERSSIPEDACISGAINVIDWSSSSSSSYSIRSKWNTSLADFTA